MTATQIPVKMVEHVLMKLMVLLVHVLRGGRDLHVVVVSTFLYNVNVLK